MKILWILLASMFVVSAYAGGPSSEYLVTPYCLSATPTTVSGTFVTTGMVQPTSNASTTIELTGTDVVTGNQNYYVVTITTGTGYATSLPSCPIQYSTKQ